MAPPQIIGDPDYEILPYDNVQMESRIPIYVIHLFVNFAHSPPSTQDPVHFTNFAMLSYATLMKNNNTDAIAMIDNFLEAVNISSSLFCRLTNEIINYGMKMWIDKDHNLSVRVNINAFVDELPLQPSNDDGDDDEYDRDEVPINFVAASEKSIEKLERVQIKDDRVSCPICLENISVGSKATRLPCAHTYHENCIVKWLQTSKFCPLCRNELA